MTKAANLSDVANVATARDNLGLGTAATADVGGEAGGIVPSGASLLHNRYVVHNGGEIFTSNERPPRFATTDPTVNDDSDAEYGVGTRWHNTVTGRVWVSFDDTDGAAVWRELARHDDTRFPTADEKADLAAAAALSGTGLLAQTSTGNYALRTIADDASGNITWANPAGIAGNPLATLDSSLAAINSITSATGQGLTLATLDSNADLTLDPHGTGRIVLPNATRLWLPGQAAGGFALSTSGTTFDGTVNEVLYLGYNLGPGGTRIDTGDAAIGIEIEGNYDTGATHYTELHFKGIDTAGVSTRWMTFIVPRLNSRQAAINFNTDDRIYFNSGDGSLQTAVLFRDASSSELQLFGPGSDQWRIRAFNDGRIIFHDQTAGTFPFQIGANYLEAGGSTVLRFYGSSSADAGLAHNASAGTLEINSGTIGALRDLALRALTASTTVTTAAGVAWDLGGYTAGAPTADGYLTVIAGGATYRIAADLQ